MGLEEIRKARVEKLKKLQKAGVNPYPAKSSRTHTIGEAVENFDEFAKENKKLVLTGRILAKREHGGSTFLDIEDGSSPCRDCFRVESAQLSLRAKRQGQLRDGDAKIQLFFKEDSLGKKNYRLFLDTIDIGDFIEAAGVLFKTKQSEKTLEVEKWGILAKSLLPLPEKWHGLQDAEEKYRKRYLDLLFNPELKAKFRERTKIVEHIRQFLIANGFMEVETPVLQTIPGGANAKPFKTHLNTLNLDLYLRIAPELYLKRLLVAGFERVFEIARNFRNEGMDREHNPEFTMLEFYAAYWDYEKLMDFLEKMLEHVVGGNFGKTKIKFQDKDIDFKGPYKRATFNDLFKKYSGLDYDKSGEGELKQKAGELGITIEKSMTKGNIGDEIYKKVARPFVIAPTFVINHPLEISPLAKKLDDDPAHVARFQLVAGGTELLNGFSELNDPLDQRERFEAQEKIAKKLGNEEAHRMDENFIEALEYGMPPAAGVGIGIDRLVAILTDSHSIREVILFPLMKPRSG